MRTKMKTTLGDANLKEIFGEKTGLELKKELRHGFRIHDFQK